PDKQWFCSVLTDLRGGRGGGGAYPLAAWHTLRWHRRKPLAVKRSGRASGCATHLAHPAPWHTLPRAFPRNKAVPKPPCGTGLLTRPDGSGEPSCKVLERLPSYFRSVGTACVTGRGAAELPGAGAPAGPHPLAGSVVPEAGRAASAPAPLDRAGR